MPPMNAKNQTLFGAGADLGLGSSTTPNEDDEEEKKRKERLAKLNGGSAGGPLVGPMSAYADLGLA